MTRKHDYYQALGVRRNATAEEIRGAYRRLARTYHPDVNASEDAVARFAEVSEAYEVLGDADRRRAYDRFGSAGVGARAGGRPGAGATVNVDIGSIFEEMFGGRGASPFGSPHVRRGEPARGRDVEHVLQTSFLTAALGGHERIRITTDGDARSVEVRIPAGIETGAKLRLRGRGHAGPSGGRPGDLILTIEVGRHPWFRREGLNVLIDVPVTLAEAALGATVRVPLLRGSATIRIAPGAASGRRLRLKGKGAVNEAGRAGDFFAVVQIVAPPSLSDEARALVERLAPELQNPRDSGPWADMASENTG